MKGKRWIAAALVVALLTVTATGAVVLAGGSGGGTPGESIISRVAAILGLDEDQVQDAFDQAVTEVRDERFQSRLDALVESGRITREQADEYLEWRQARPDFLFDGARTPGFRGFGFHHGGPRFGLQGHGMLRWKSTPTPEPASLDLTSL